MVKIIWDKVKLERFRKVYQRAIDEGLERFTFEGHGFIVGYAKHLITFLDNKLH